MIKKLLYVVAVAGMGVLEAAPVASLTHVSPVEIWRTANSAYRFSYVTGELPEIERTLLLSRRDYQWLERTFKTKQPGYAVTEVGTRFAKQFASLLRKKVPVACLFKCPWDMKKSFAIQVTFNVEDDKQKTLFTDIQVYGAQQEYPQHLLEFAKTAVMQRSWFVLNKYKMMAAAGVAAAYGIAKIYSHLKFKSEMEEMLAVSQAAPWLAYVDGASRGQVEEYVALLRQIRENSPRRSMEDYAVWFCSVVESTEVSKGDSAVVESAKKALSRLDQPRIMNAIAVAQQTWNERQGIPAEEKADEAECPICFQNKLGDLWVLEGAAGLGGARGRGYETYQPCSCNNFLCGQCIDSLTNQHRCPFCNGGFGSRAPYCVTCKSKLGVGACGHQAQRVQFWARRLLRRYPDASWAIGALVALAGAHFFDARSE